MGTVFLKNERSRIFMQRLIGGRNMFESTFKAEIVLIIRERVSFVVYCFYQAASLNVFSVERVCRSVELELEKTLENFIAAFTTRTCTNLTLNIQPALMLYVFTLKWPRCKSTMQTVRLLWIEPNQLLLKHQVARGLETRISAQV